ncbi:Gfo/Idh/MocA family protein [Brevibacillus fulvus]|uniref:Dehydrogenase n=1 Tax=Brevibacillus fulvus TaxID=1125967 RepID=A0A938XZ12_9BACL|nr:Gfo/Idh/MocA family oxidoreductase [Brevibacillus fulvus]MBM7590411.1 putative dehydrogenase [Brevibacillus fulvus]
MVRFGVIGTNFITERFIQAASLVEDFALTAVYSRTAQRARQFAEPYGVTHLFTDLEQMAKSDAIDAVYIASPNSLHAEQAILFMEHGKHVLCEKPIASHAGELEKMIATSRAKRVALMEAMKSTMLPSFQAIVEHLPKIGPIRRFLSTFCQYSSRYDALKAGTVLNAFNPELSNGSLMDIGVYCIYPSIVLFGEPLSVKANALMLPSGVDGQGSLLLKYEEMETVIQHSKITDSALPSEIQGEQGSIVIDKIHRPQHVEIRYRDGRTEDISRPQASQEMMYEVREFIQLIKTGQLQSSTNSHERSLATMRVMDEARKQIGLTFPADSIN